jgi:putative inorganic carbon (hco3(-)) transporter
LGKIVVYILLLCVAGISLFKPWIGVVASYLIIILTPQNIWWWQFEGVRPVLFILLPTILGFALSLVNGRLQLSTLWNTRNFFLFVLWVFFCLSSFFGPYAHVESEYRSFDSSWALSLVNNIFILYFMACVCIDEEKKLKVMAWVITLSTIYLIYWINNQYFSHNLFGRIGGPQSFGGSHGGSVYRDENSFAMLFVTGIPFLYFMGQSCKKKILRYGIWLIIPFGWHSIFLTGSRGGLLGVTITVLVVILRSKHKLVASFLFPLFILFFIWQGGDVMKSRSQTIGGYEKDASAVGRIQAWEAASKMVIAHPVVGVGIASFLPAFSDYSDHQPREAHNTFFQISAESGIVAGASYLVVVFSSFIFLFKNSKSLRNNPDQNGNNFLFLLNEALFCSLCGFVVCSLFLSLQVFEIFYFLYVLINSVEYLSKKNSVSSNSI